MHPGHALAAGEYDSDSRLDFAKRILTDAKNDGGVHSGTGKEVMLFWENERRARGYHTLIRPDFRIIAACDTDSAHTGRYDA